MSFPSRPHAQLQADQHSPLCGFFSIPVSSVPLGCPNPGALHAGSSIPLVSFAVPHPGTKAGWGLRQGTTALQVAAPASRWHSAHQASCSIGVKREQLHSCFLYGAVMELKGTLCTQTSGCEVSGEQARSASWLSLGAKEHL